MRKLRLTKEGLEGHYVTEGMSTYQIADKYRCSRTYISKLLKKHGIPARQCNGKYQEPYVVNEDFFKTWSSEMAYVLGYITADGGVRPKKYELKIKSIDYELLEHVNEVMCSNHLITKEKNGNCYVLYIYSKKVVEDLISLGIVPKKTYCIAGMPPVPDTFFWDYLRGEIDGDGSINPPITNSMMAGMNIVGHENLLLDLRKLLMSKTGCPEYALNYNCEHDKSATLPIYGEFAYSIFEKCYNNERYGLSRKKSLAIKCLNHKASLSQYRCSDCGEENVRSSVKTKYCARCSISRNKKCRERYERAKDHRSHKHYPRGLHRVDASNGGAKH